MRKQIYINKKSVRTVVNGFNQLKDQKIIYLEICALFYWMIILLRTDF
jgi:hypothetical protein